MPGKSRLASASITSLGIQQITTSTSPGPEYSNDELRARMHFINCHGATTKPEFYGHLQKEDGSTSKPISLTTDATANKIVEGTVACAFECCYGAELYNSVKTNVKQPICQSYLHQGAYGYFGSLATSYGPVGKKMSRQI